jgi:hypothetical protein
VDVFADIPHLDRPQAGRAVLDDPIAVGIEDGTAVELRVGALGAGLLGARVAMSVAFRLPEKSWNVLISIVRATSGPSGNRLWPCA